MLDSLSIQIGSVVSPNWQNNNYICRGQLKIHAKRSGIELPFVWLKKLMKSYKKALY